MGPTCYNNSDEEYSENSFVRFLLTFDQFQFLSIDFFQRWGRGNPEEYPPINLGGDDSRYDPMDDKKPRTGQILWIRGLTRLQTQVSNAILLFDPTDLPKNLNLFFTPLF